ncbi:hypothetical protein BBP40_007496 [Aspergillus hancockii]|nr:hypothetical protein BBP40_007496 [Aspergillus hancockii]
MFQHPWHDLLAKLAGALANFNTATNTNKQLLAFTDSEHQQKDITFAIRSVSSDKTILVSLNRSRGAAKHFHPNGTNSSPHPRSPYQSYWGLFGQNIRQEGVEVIGDQLSFAKYAHIWRTMLEVLHDVYCGPNDVETPEPDDEGFITGRYVYLNLQNWSRCKIFYEQSGTGKQDIASLHTVGADSRQYHGFMNDVWVREKCNMIASDLLSHGRSFPSSGYALGGHSNSEDCYVECIAAIACLAVAIRAEEAGVRGTIPLQAYDRVEMDREWCDKSPFINGGTFNPEWGYGMMCPTAPLENRQLLWHIHSSQAYGVYHGDLAFYFNDWDGRGLGQYDWSNTPTMSEATAKKVPGAQLKVMPNLGHFTATENPATFVPYPLEAIDYIVKAS